MTKMEIELIELLTIFQEEIIPPLILENPDEFYDAFQEGPDNLHAFWIEKWEWMLQSLPVQVEYPLRFDMDCLALNDSEEEFAALLTLEFPDSSHTENIRPALYVSVLFGAGISPRLFGGEHAELLQRGDTIQIVEYTQVSHGKNAGIRRHKFDVLYQGCNNEPIVFEAPACRKTVDRTKPLCREEWYTAYMDEVIKICLNDASYTG